MPNGSNCSGVKGDPTGGELWKARSRLCRSQMLQVNMRLKALAEICTMHLDLLFSIAQMTVATSEGQTVPPNPKICHSKYRE